MEEVGSLEKIHKYRRWCVFVCQVVNDFIVYLFLFCGVNINNVADDD